MSSKVTVVDALSVRSAPDTDNDVVTNTESRRDPAASTDFSSGRNPEPSSSIEQSPARETTSLASNYEPCTTPGQPGTPDNDPTRTYVQSATTTHEPSQAPERSHTPEHSSNLGEELEVSPDTNVVTEDYNSSDSGYESGRSLSLHSSTTSLVPNSTFAFSQTTTIVVETPREPASSSSSITRVSSGTWSETKNQNKHDSDTSSLRSSSNYDSSGGSEMEVGSNSDAEILFYGPLVEPAERWTWPAGGRYVGVFPGAADFFTREETERLVNMGFLIVDDVGITWAISEDYLLLREFDEDEVLDGEETPVPEETIDEAEA